MTTAMAAREVMALYPRIYFACHTRHVRDPHSQKLLSRHQASVLDHLDDVDALTLNGLARHMGVTPGTMSLTIDRLERKGYVVRLRDVADKRRVQVRLTTAGVRMREASSVLDPPFVEALMARLTDEERQAAVHGLGLLADAAQRQMGQRAADGQRRKAEQDAAGAAGPARKDEGLA
jgi:MarR family transcriptional regulator, organic hydroperoxide resistance regulator